jgi:hypothetical protein
MLGPIVLSLALVLAASMAPLAFALTCSIDPQNVPSTTSCLSDAAASMYADVLLCFLSLSFFYFARTYVSVLKW